MSLNMLLSITIDEKAASFTFLIAEFLLVFLRGGDDDKSQVDMDNRNSFVMTQHTGNLSEPLLHLQYL